VPITQTNRLHYYGNNHSLLYESYEMHKLTLRGKNAEFLYIHVTMHHNRFLFNNQPDELIIQIYSVIKPYVFRASSWPIIRSFPLALVSFKQVLMTASKQSHQKPA